jgi:ABC-2 type transport system permease protein
LTHGQVALHHRSRRGFSDANSRTEPSVVCWRFKTALSHCRGKALVVAVWGACTCAWVIGLGFVVGALVVLPGWSTELAFTALGTIIAVAAMIIGLQTTTAFFLGCRGYIPALAWPALTMFLAKLISVLGWGAWFPWAVPALVSGAVGPEGEALTPASYLVAGLAIAAGFVATIVWWEEADQTG